ncbi:MULTISPECIES: endonuclease [Aeromonas]|uniref:endonuclease n=1 Tax=Aeromonas TaxID=642 RepID=UPI0011DFC9F0|nr:endonuclease [Aeromonas sobria]
MSKMNRYSSLIEDIFLQKYTPGAKTVKFVRTDIEDAAVKLAVKLPKNLGDVIYSFKYRASLPKRIMSTAEPDMDWVIKNIGRAQYAFQQVKFARIAPDPMMATIKIHDSTPSIVGKYALNDEQALLTKLRYNRLIDIFTGVTCFSLQNHLRTTVPNVGQVETDELYVGIDKSGRQYIFPVQAKGGTDEIGTVQIEQDILLCQHKYPELICRPIAAQFVEIDKIAIFEFVIEDGSIKKSQEKQYLLVDKNGISLDELISYNKK